ncbi:uncharacterized protein F4822DRAFT_439453 [Hypoxylon trugodes]|uniref:uncharacterized protein n=1 Tax=Hypoxylon trugodes TaxID=326681 RepID=UPI00219DF81B|nr:uncharacterized protein F4822DRAFT_439453 [Hypoxylon trugodes]KAI1393375.1 hypothetical protein F4822DRAFT_439453 [Hypoxylon trugodes]
MASMATYDSHDLYYLPFSLDVARKIGDHMAAPFELMKLALVCKQARQAIDTTEMVKKDIQVQRETTREDLGRNDFSTVDRRLDYEEDSESESDSDSDSDSDSVWRLCCELDYESTNYEPNYEPDLESDLESDLELEPHYNPKPSASPYWYLLESGKSRPDDNIGRPNCRKVKKLSKLHGPSLIYAIRDGKDIEDIKKHIEIYREHFALGLEGRWWPNHNKQTRRDIYQNLPSPMYVAAQNGRLDIVQILHELGIDMRGRCHCDEYYTDNERYGFWGCGALGLPRHVLLRPSFYLSGREYLPHIYQDINLPDKKLRVFGADNAFLAACCFGHEDIALFMITNGLEVRPGDLYIAARYARYKVMAALLRCPIFNTGDRCRLILTAAQWIIPWTKGIRYGTRWDRQAITISPDPRVYLYLLNIVKAEQPSFNKIGWLERMILPKIRSLSTRDVKKFYDAIITDSEALARLGPNLAIQFARQSRYFEFMKAILAGCPWNIPKRKMPNLIGQMLISAISRWNEKTIRYLLDLGSPFTQAHLQAAIILNDVDLVDKIIASGRVKKSCNFPEGHDRNPVACALQQSYWGYSRRSFDIVLRLVSAGFDYRNIPDAARADFTEWVERWTTNYRIDISDSEEGNLFWVQLDNVATKVLGEDYKFREGVMENIKTT